MGDGEGERVFRRSVGRLGYTHTYTQTHPRPTHTGQGTGGSQVEQGQAKRRGAAELSTRVGGMELREWMWAGLGWAVLGVG